MKLTTLIAATGALTLISLGAANAAELARSDIQDREGNSVGDVTVEATASGRVVLKINLNSLPDGTHGVHIHETGDCSAEDFTSAGGHLAHDASHGVGSEAGPHPGDLPNLTVHDDGAAQVEYFSADLNIDGDLLDEDGAAFIVHSEADDYQSQPSGAAGDRIACGEFIAG